jgi:hypothetical protein
MTDWSFGRVRNLKNNHHQLSGDITSPILINIFSPLFFPSLLSDATCYATVKLCKPPNIGGDDDQLGVRDLAQPS